MLKNITKHLKKRTLLLTIYKSIIKTNTFKRGLEKVVCFYLKFKGKITQDVINNPYEIIFIPPELIINQINIRESAFRLRVKKYFNHRVRIVGLILDGEWDLDIEKISDCPLTIGMKERFLEGKEWDDTIYFREIYFWAKHKKKTWVEYKNNEMKMYDLIYENMKEHGYKQQKNAMPYNREINGYIGKPENEVEICVSRSGELLLYDGRHRLFLAQILKIERIPVIVNLWHKQYIEQVLINTKRRRLTPVDAIKPVLNDFYNHYNENIRTKDFRIGKRKINSKG